MRRFKLFCFVQLRLKNNWKQLKLSFNWKCVRIWSILFHPLQTSFNYCFFFPFNFKPSSVHKVWQSKTLSQLYLSTDSYQTANMDNIFRTTLSEPTDRFYSTLAVDETISFHMPSFVMWHIERTRETPTGVLVTNIEFHFM